MSALSNGIKKLPQTFQDAIHICRKLEFDYLWIGSLCIIQSDAGDPSDSQHISDWQYYVKIMDSIYQNCTINIAAAHGQGPSSGCCAYRKPPGIALCRTPIRSLSLRGDLRTLVRNDKPTLHVILEGRKYHKVQDCSIGRFHLDSRGWVAQERLLSPRILHFAEEEIF
jgi:hypothetical protein